MAIQVCRLNVDETGREHELRGTPMFPCGAYRTDLSKNMTGDVPWHWHEEIEVISVQKGTARIGLEGAEFLLSEHEGLFINSGALHSARIASPCGCVIDSLVFFPSLLSGMPESIFEQKYIRPLISCAAVRAVPFRRGTKWQEQAVSLLEEAFASYEESRFGYELIVREKLSLLWLLVLSRLPSPEENGAAGESRNSIRIKEMMNFIHEHYSDTLTLQDIACSVHLSERECLRCFKQSLKLSPIQYLMKYRLSKAAGLLTDSELPVTEIAARCGFDSPSYFTSIFKRQFGRTPSEYRKNNRVPSARLP